jgi:4-amino-4-deoxy-L-arabinose transferase-like glycosyltransferase
MLASDVRVQSTVRSLDQGRLGAVVKVAALAALIAGLSLLYLFVQFRGLATPDAMDQAQIARRLADRKGFTTDYIRPLAMSVLQRQGGTAPFDLSEFPDFFQSPLHPWVSSFGLRLIKADWKMELTDIVYTGDRMVAAVSMVFFLLSVGVLYLVLARLFDRRLGLFGCAAVLLTDLMWQFSLSALPQMLVLFLFCLASLATLFGIEARAESYGRATTWLAGAGGCFGLATLAHGLAVWIFLGWLVFVGFYFFPRGVAAAAALAVYTLVVAPWLARNFQVSGNPFGLAIYGAFFNAPPEESYLRNGKVDVETSGTTLQGKARAHIVQQIQMIFGYLGMNAAAASFFPALFHPFRNGMAQAFKWCVLLMWLFALLGMALYHPTGVISENQFHVLFIPLFAGYGMAFLVVLWNRLDLRSQLLRNVFVLGLLFVCAIPMVLTLFAGQKSRIHWPPYVPPYIAIMRDWFRENEIICSDMPWAIAWYAQRISLLLPDSVRTFNRMHDYGETLQPIRGLYLTPITGDQPLFSGIYKGAYKDWAALITRPPQVRGFPLTEFASLPIDSQCIIFSDRSRWNQARTLQP